MMKVQRKNVKGRKVNLHSTASLFCKLISVDVLTAEAKDALAVEKAANKQAKVDALAREKEEKEKENRKPIKYPIEDLDLDPMSIFDGRVLRRINVELPPLPPKGITRKELPVPVENFENFLMIWNFLNVFG